MKNILIIGASRGLGDAFSVGLPDTGDHVFLVSRSEPASLNRDDGVIRHWIEADLAGSNAGEILAEGVGNLTLDLLIYSAGIWEQKSFEEEPAENLQKIIAVNLTSAITSIHALLPNLKKARDAKIVLIGSTSGLDNEGGRAVAYTASKFGIRGLAHSLREYLRKDGITVTCINPGSMATDLSFDEGAGAAIKKHDGKRIPVQDIVSLVKMLTRLSPVSCVKELHVPSLNDTDA